MSLIHPFSIVDSVDSPNIQKMAGVCGTVLCSCYKGNTTHTLPGSHGHMIRGINVNKIVVSVIIVVKEGLKIK